MTKFKQQRDKFCCSPVLLSTAHHSSDQSGKRTLQPMRWGLIPQWHKGDRASFKAMHNNCRGETISEKSTFSVPFSKGKRCVVIAEGYGQLPCLV